MGGRRGSRGRGGKTVMGESRSETKEGGGERGMEGKEKLEGGIERGRTERKSKIKGS